MRLPQTRRWVHVLAAFTLAGCGSEGSRLPPDAPTPLDARDVADATVPIDTAQPIDSPLAVDAAVDAPPVDAPPVASFDGQWSGMTSQGRALSFSVLDHAIGQVTVAFAVPSCGVTGTSTTTFGNPIPISEQGGFTVNVSSVPLSYAISGTLTISGTGSGSVAFTYAASFPLPCTGSATATWSVTRAPELE